jgi:hypothetical protein
VFVVFPSLDWILGKSELPKSHLLFWFRVLAPAVRELTTTRLAIESPRESYRFAEPATTIVDGWVGV